MCLHETMIAFSERRMALASGSGISFSSSEDIKLLA